MAWHKEYGVAWACGHRQYTLDKHDRDTMHTLHLEVEAKEGS